MSATGMSGCLSHNGDNVIWKRCLPIEPWSFLERTHIRIQVAAVTGLHATIQDLDSVTKMRIDALKEVDDSQEQVVAAQEKHNHIEALLDYTRRDLAKAKAKVPKHEDALTQYHGFK